MSSSCGSHLFSLNWAGRDVFSLTTRDLIFSFLFLNQIILLYADPIFSCSGPAIFFYDTLLPHQPRYGYGHKIRLQDVNNIKLGKHINKNLIVYDQCPSYWNILKIS